MLDQVVAPKAPARPVLPGAKTLPDMFLARSERTPHRVAYRRKVEKQWVSSTWRDFYEGAASIATWLFQCSAKRFCPTMCAAISHRHRRSAGCPMFWSNPESNNSWTRSSRSPSAIRAVRMASISPVRSVLVRVPMGMGVGVIPGMLVPLLLRWHGRSASATGHPRSRKQA